MTQEQEVREVTEARGTLAVHPAETSLPNEEVHVRKFNRTFPIQLLIKRNENCILVEMSRKGAIQLAESLLGITKQ